MSHEPGSLLRYARSLRGISQRELAAAAGTSQSVVGRIECNAVSPAVDTLSRLLAAAGFELSFSLRETIGAPEQSVDGPSHMLSDVGRILELTPTQRLQELTNLSKFVARAKRV